MSSDVWQQRLIYGGMSLFLAWHTLALALAPLPDGSEAVTALRAFFSPYLTLFRLDNKWNFYAPNVGKGHQLRYVIDDGAGQRHAFVPTDGLSWYHPGYWWVRARHDAVIEDPQARGDAIAADFCQKHAALRPVTVTLQKLEEKDFTPADHLQGRHPLESDFATVSTLKRVRCSGS